MIQLSNRSIKSKFQRKRANKQQPDCPPVSKTIAIKKPKYIYKVKEQEEIKIDEQQSNDISMQNCESTASSANQDNDIMDVNQQNTYTDDDDNKFNEINQPQSQQNIDEQNDNQNSQQSMELEGNETSNSEEQEKQNEANNTQQNQIVKEKPINQELYDFVFKHTYSDVYQIKKVGGVVVNQKKFYKYNDTRYKMRKNKNYKFLLPKKTRNVLKTIVLDMDETLIYTFPEVYLSNVNYQYKTVIRPHLLEFLRELKKHYELVLFTAAEEDYTRRILLGFGIIDEFDHLLFRQHMTPSDIEYADDDSFNNVKQVFTKDLTYLGRQLRHVCIIDDKKQRFEKQPNNGIEIPRWVGKDKNDNALKILKDFFLLLKSDQQSYEKFNFSKGQYKNFKLNYKQIESFTKEQTAKRKNSANLHSQLQQEQQNYITDMKISSEQDLYFED